MLRKRLLGTVLVREGWAVQSFGYRRWLPLGKPECLVQNLDHWVPMALWCFQLTAGIKARILR